MKTKLLQLYGQQFSKNCSTPSFTSQRLPESEPSDVIGASVRQREAMHVSAARSPTPSSQPRYRRRLRAWMGPPRRSVWAVSDSSAVDLWRGGTAISSSRAHHEQALAGAPLLFAAVSRADKLKDVLFTFASTVGVRLCAC